MTSEMHYGSDSTGFVWGYHFTGGQPATPVSSAEVADYLHKITQPEGGFLWLHFSLANSATRAWLQHNLTLPESFFEVLQEQTGSTRLEQDGESLIAVIHDVRFDFHVDSTEVSAGRLYIDRTLVISTRLRPLRSIEQLKSDVREGEIFATSIELLAHLLQDQAGVLIAILRAKSVRIDQIEDRLLANRISFQRSELGAIRRVLVRLQRLLAPEPAAFFRLLNRSPAWVSDAELTVLRQAAEEFSLATGDAANLIERVKLLQEELAALVNEQSNRTLQLLTVVTVLALPINIIAGLFGMNVGGIPWSDSDFGFKLVLGGTCVFTLTLAVSVMSRFRE